MVNHIAIPGVCTSMSRKSSATKNGCRNPSAMYIKHQEFFFKPIHREFMVYRSKTCTMHAIPTNWPFLGFSERATFFGSYRKTKAFLVWPKKWSKQGSRRLTQLLGTSSVDPSTLPANRAQLPLHFGGHTCWRAFCPLYKVVLPGLPERARPPLNNQAPGGSTVLTTVPVEESHNLTDGEPLAAATARARCLRSLPPPLPRLGRRERPELPCPFLAFPPAGLRFPSSRAALRPLSPLPPFDSWGGGEGERLRLSRRLPGEGRWVGGPVHKAPKAPAVEWTRSWPIQALRRSGPSAATFAPRHMGSTVCLRHRSVAAKVAERHGEKEPFTKTQKHGVLLTNSCKMTGRYFSPNGSN